MHCMGPLWEWALSWLTVAGVHGTAGMAVGCPPCMHSLHADVCNHGNGTYARYCMVPVMMHGQGKEVSTPSGHHADGRMTLVAWQARGSPARRTDPSSSTGRGLPPVSACVGDDSSFIQMLRGHS
jgi:hypothetical protein